jgi:uncharacterized Tic20 family protein
MEEKATSEEVKTLSQGAFKKVETTSDERTWAILAHVSILLGAITVGLLGPVAAFVIWLIKKEESDYVAKQAMQSLVYQVVVAVLSWIMWGAIIVLSLAVIGICLIPLAVLLDLAAIGYGCYAAYVCSLGQEFRYPIIWEMVTTK